MKNMQHLCESNLEQWTRMYTENLSEEELSESTTDQDLLNTMFSTMLYFLCGQGNTVLKDEEWMNYLKNDINTAISKGLFTPSFEDKKHIKQLMQPVDEKEEVEEPEDED